MKLTYLASFGTRFPSSSASSIHIMRMCEAFSQIGHEVTLLVSDQGKSPEEIFEFYGIDKIFRILIIPISKTRGRAYLFSLMQAKSAWKMHSDVIVGRSIQSCTIMALLKFPVVFDSHGPVWESNIINQLAYKLLRRSKYLVKFTVNSNGLKSIYENEGYTPDCGITVAHNGSAPVSLTDTPIEWPGRVSVIQIGYMGHLYPGRGIEIIIECANRLPEFDFHIVGGAERDIVFWKHKASLPNLFFHGFVKPSEVYRYRNACNILLAPYQSAGVAVAGGSGDSSAYMNPIKIVEYMSSRKPIICSNMPILKELLDDDCSLFAQSDDVNAWVSAIKELKNQALRSSLAEMSYRKFCQLLTWTARAKILLDLPNNALHKPNV